MAVSAVVVLIATALTAVGAALAGAPPRHPRAVAASPVTKCCPADDFVTGEQLFSYDQCAYQAYL